MRAEDLAAIYETSVRTIYRDIQALSESGVPVVGAPGVGYSLVDGYFLPPVNFTEEEAVAMLIGTDFIQQKFDAAIGDKAKSAQRKIESILPVHVREEVSRIRSTMKLIAAHVGNSGNEEVAFLETLRRALLERKKVRFHYQKKMEEADGNRKSTRVVAPYGLVLVHGSWALVAHCDLRHDIRHFRLSRMKGLTLLEESYTLPDNFQLQRYRPPDNRNIVVRILADASIRDKVEESKNFFMEAIEEHPEGLLIRFRVNHPDELLSWVLGWGANVTVLEPDSLRCRVREEIRKMIKRY